MDKGSKMIVISGVTKGLGRALAEEYLKLGHLVIGCGRSIKHVGNFSKMYPSNADFQVVDISDYKASSATYSTDAISRLIPFKTWKSSNQ